MVPSYTFMTYLPDTKVNLLSHSLTILPVFRSNTLQSDSQFLLFSSIRPVFVTPEIINTNFSQSYSAHSQSILETYCGNKLVATTNTSYTTDRFQVNVQYQNCTLSFRIVNKAKLPRMSIFILFHSFSTGIVVDILSFSQMLQISIIFWFLQPTARNFYPIDISVMVSLVLNTLNPILYKYKRKALLTSSQTVKLPSTSSTAIQALSRLLPYLEHSRQ